MLPWPAVPELPEVETVRRSLEPAIVGRRVERAEAGPVPLRLGPDIETWRRWVVGRRLEGLGRRGKYLLGWWGEAVGILHLGMSGRLVVQPEHRPRPPHTHFVLCFEGGRELRMVDPRRFGMAVVVPAAELASFAPLAALGPDPLEGDVTPLLVAAAARSRVAMRNLLLDQRVLAGLGNIYANEALFRAGIHPLRRADRVAARRVRLLARAVHEVLEDALVAGGTTLADGGFVDAEGRNGYFAVSLGVYGREGLPCPRCGAPVRRRSAQGRSVYFCPRCQR